MAAPATLHPECDAYMHPPPPAAAQLGRLTLLPGPPGISMSYALLEIGPCSMIVSGSAPWQWLGGRAEDDPCHFQSGYVCLR